MSEEPHYEGPLRHPDIDERTDKAVDRLTDNAGWVYGDAIKETGMDRELQESELTEIIETEPKKRYKTADEIRLESIKAAQRVIWPEDSDSKSQE